MIGLRRRSGVSLAACSRGAHRSRNPCGCDQCRPDTSIPGRRRARGSSAARASRARVRPRAQESASRPAADLVSCRADERCSRCRPRSAAAIDAQPVCCSRECSRNGRRSGADALRATRQRRVPEPPERMTGWISMAAIIAPRQHASPLGQRVPRSAPPCGCRARVRRTRARLVLARCNGP